MEIKYVHVLIIDFPSWYFTINIYMNYFCWNFKKIIYFTVIFNVNQILNGILYWSN